MENASGKDHSVEHDNFDRGIVPAETAARKEREGEDFKKPEEQKEGSDKDSIDTNAGATVSNEGLANNYAIEPEMYVNEPGDLPDDQ
ncbi:MAG: hypothetical protein WBA76_00035 [Phormidesmis sp.]